MNRARTFLLSCVAVVFFAATSWAEVNPGWGKWWLPPVRSAHGDDIDNLFYWIFWITMITFVAVEGVMLVFLIKYRSRPEKKKAYFTHGNTRLEMAWTVAPAIILALLALGSKKVWDNYRYSPASEDPNRATILVVGQQFKWNFIYPGPDGKLGRYLLFPKPTDAKWPVGADGSDQTFDGVPGPASLPYLQAVAAINKYIDSENPLGKDFADPDGKDDNFEKAPGRGLVIPAHRPIEVQLSSKDVLHDFFLPNFRVKLDAVPGMRGRLFFTATMTSAERRKVTTKTVAIDRLDAELAAPGGADAVIVIDETAPGDEKNKEKTATGWRYFTGTTRKTTVMRNAATFGEADTRKIRIEGLRAAGLTEVKISIVEVSGDWELVCEELCGLGHNTMTAPVTVVTNEEYESRKFDKPYQPAPSTQPAVAVNQAR